MRGDSAIDSPHLSMRPQGMRHGYLLILHAYVICLFVSRLSCTQHTLYIDQTHNIDYTYILLKINMCARVCLPFSMV